MYIPENHTFSDSYNPDDSNTLKTKASYPTDYSDRDSKSNNQIPSGMIVAIILISMCSISKCICICMLWSKKQSWG